VGSILALNLAKKDFYPQEGDILKGKSCARVEFHHQILLLCLFVFCASRPAFAQQTVAATDSSHINHTALAQRTPAQTDSSDVYRKIETFSKKNKFTKFMHGLIFKPVAAIPLKERLSKPLLIRYRDFEGKIIRNIDIVTLAPFGYSVSDTAAAPHNLFLKTGNWLHVKTRLFTINNILLIRNNERFDSLLVKESERLVRSQGYVGDVLFEVVPTGEATDSVDIHVRVLDKWSFIPEGTFSSKRLGLGFSENDFVGLGHEFHAGYDWDLSDGKNGAGTDYFIPNIRNSHISAALHYNVDEYDNFLASLDIERPFYSPLARWAAGVNIAQQLQRDSFPDPLFGHVIQKLNFNTQDYWAGTANGILKGNSEDERFTKAIVAGRYLRIRYLEKPDELHDSLHVYSNEDLYLAGVGISTLKYFQDNYIFNFGVTEDVPIGRVYGITGGYQTWDTIGRLYLGARISFGDYHPWGYLSSTFEYGTFIHGPLFQQGVFSAGANYFSTMFNIGSWRIRQFVKPQITWGMNRFSYDSLTINNQNGIRGFNGAVGGTRKIVLTLQTQSYSPWNVAGFRFGPYMNYSVGMLGSAASGFKSSRVYSQLGVGALIKNDYLVFSNFQLSVAYYPFIPGSGFNVFKINSFVTTDFGFGDFVFGKPEIVAFQ
jgi:hypothetical protein